MTTRYYVRFLVGSLRRQRGRTLLTLLGVTVGAAALVITLSIGFGLRDLIDREFKKRGMFWEVIVSPKQNRDLSEDNIPPESIAVPDGLTGERRDRARRRLIERYHSLNADLRAKPLTKDQLCKFKALPDVKDVYAAHNEYSQIRLGNRSHSAMTAARRTDTLMLESRLTAGRLPTRETAAEAVVTEKLLWELDIRTDADYDQVLGRKIELKLGASGGKTINLAGALGFMANRLSTSEEQLLAKLTQQLPNAVDRMELDPAERAAMKRLFAEQERLKSEQKLEGVHARFKDAPESVDVEFTIVGIVRDFTPAEQKALDQRFEYILTYSDVFLTEDAGQAAFEQFPWIREQGYAAATVKIAPGGDLRGVVTAIENDGFDTLNMLSWYDSVKMEVTLIAGGLNLFAMVSIIVAAIGIANTLATSVVERTREIGILKSVGATSQQIRIMFLLEGTFIGFIAGCLGVLLAWLAIWPGDAFVASLVKEQSQGQLAPTTVFIFPVWLPFAAILFTMTMTTLAAYLPARRAARMQPVDALRAL